jgi:hypothetical protein
MTCLGWERGQGQETEAVEVGYISKAASRQAARARQTALQPLPGPQPALGGLFGSADCSGHSQSKIRHNCCWRHTYLCAAANRCNDKRVFNRVHDPAPGHTHTHTHTKVAGDTGSYGFFRHVWQ